VARQAQAAPRAPPVREARLALAELLAQERAAAQAAQEARERQAQVVAVMVAPERRAA
jgi:hypothetical protein